MLGRAILAKAAKTKLTSLSEIYAYFRQNQTPITFLSPTLTTFWASAAGSTSSNT
jgi:hypothetical protein